MTERLRTCSSCLFILILAAGAAGAPGDLPEACNGLSGEQKALALELMASEYPYDCCDDTIEKCLREEPVCSLAWRLAGSICRRVGLGQDAERVRRSLSRRARSMLPGASPAVIDLKGAPVIGDGEAPVEVVVYACARCRYCSKIVPELHGSITSGALKGRARLFFKVFPIRGHEFSKESGLAFVAAIRQDRFWEFLLHSYEGFDRFSVDRLPEDAETAGMDRALFERHVADTATREALVESKKEGIRNGVEATPTFFIDKRPYMGDMTFEELVDVIGEAYDNATGRIYLKP